MNTNELFAWIGLCLLLFLPVVPHLFRRKRLKEIEYIQREIDKAIHEAHEIIEASRRNQ
jgi:hypothetical protein